MRAALWLLALLTVAGCGAPSGRLVLCDESGKLGNLSAAAEPLLARKATVVCIMSPRGDDLERQLSAQGLLHAPYALVVYAGLEPHHSEIRAGTHFSEDLPPRVLERIRREVLNPGLQQGSYGPAFGQTLAALDAGLAEARRNRWMVLGGLLGLGLLWLAYLLWPQVFHWLWGLTPFGWLRARRAARAQLERDTRELEQAARSLQELRARVSPSELEPRLEAFERRPVATRDLVRSQLGEARELRGLLLQCEEAEQRKQDWLRRARSALEGLRAAARPSAARRKKGVTSLLSQTAQGQLTDFGVRLEELERERPGNLVNELQRLAREVEELRRRELPDSLPRPSSPSSSHSSYEPPVASSSSSESYSNTDTWVGPSESQAGGDW